ncbi:hypothetical protein BHM03_00061236 [Ensete ventricosum]|nr:hypothetical protein BHM03_00061236 [Ensete ventricosum]
MHGTCPTPLVYTENPTITAKAKREGECSADMAGSVPSPAASKPAARVASLPPASRPPLRTLGVPMGFHGLRRSSRSRSARLVSAFCFQISSMKFRC